MCNVYRRFIKDLDNEAVPLNKKTEKGNPL